MNNDETKKVKVYTRLTPRDWHEAKVKYSTPQAQRIILKKCWNLENAIESGELCDREEARKETAREILKSMFNKMYKLTGCGVPYHVKKFIEEIAAEYGVEPFGNSEKLEDKE